MYLDFSLVALFPWAMRHGIYNKGHRVCYHVAPELMASAVVQIIRNRKDPVGPTRGSIFENLDHRFAVLVWHELVRRARAEQKTLASHSTLKDRPQPVLLGFGYRHLWNVAGPE